jgi:hypothetical protein
MCQLFDPQKKQKAMEPGLQNFAQITGQVAISRLSKVQAIT